MQQSPSKRRVQFEQIGKDRMRLSHVSPHHTTNENVQNKNLTVMSGKKKNLLNEDSRREEIFAQSIDKDTSLFDVEEDVPVMKLPQSKVNYHTTY